MNTIIFSAAGIVALVAIAFLFTHLETLRGIKWKKKLERIRNFNGYRSMKWGIANGGFAGKKKLPVIQPGLDMPVI
jgi:hypothetical protein